MYFVLQGVEKICKKYDISFMMDEVQTGGGSTGSLFFVPKWLIWPKNSMVPNFISGKMWGHEHFELEDGPDIVSFSKKMLSGGIFHKESHRPKHPGRIINTW